MSSSAPDFVVPLMRAGYSARALVYATLGVLTFSAALWGGQAQGTKNALTTLAEQPLGTLSLWVIAIGFVCYGIWRLVAAGYDLEQRGDDTSGLFERAALVVTGLIHGAMGIMVAALAIGAAGGGSGGGAEDLTAKVMQMPAGKWLVVLAGLGFAGAGVHYVIKGWKRKYERFIQVTPTTRKLDPALRAGFVCYGIILGIIGVFLAIAVWRADPSQAVGIGEALSYIRSMSFGQVLLGVFGLGFIAFALENLVEAIYRVVPGATDKTIETLASAAERAT